MSTAKNSEIYDPERLYAAARLYYEENLGQSSIATRLKVSRPTVSRMLAHAREIGMVQIQVLNPSDNQGSELSRQLASALGIKKVFLAPGMQLTNNEGIYTTDIQGAVAQAIESMQLKTGDGMIVSSGISTYSASRLPLPQLPGVVIAPAVGGLAEPEAWHQTNEIARGFAQNTGATYIPLFASAIPSKPMHRALLEDPSFQQLQHLWATAKGAILGVGSKTSGRTSLSSAIPKESLQAAEGDICLHFFDSTGTDLNFPGSERTVRIPLETLRKIPHTVVIAFGEEKVKSTIIGARMGLFNTIVTDESTARALLEELGQ
ncbi:MAG: sugar-binding domain-containing protein [Rothia sp. (in: high G+C Gram-positive bacteria)]|nr:sugar-binding domain-containing protein [Rothia sp. (in: high G+C Gram-positive bacteria)]